MFVMAVIVLLIAGTVSFNSYKANPQLQLSQALLFRGGLRATQTLKRKEIFLTNSSSLPSSWDKFQHMLYSVNYFKFCKHGKFRHLAVNVTTWNSQIHLLTSLGNKPTISDYGAKRHAERHYAKPSAVSVALARYSFVILRNRNSLSN
jgi:hypothetical protein